MAAETAVFLAAVALLMASVASQPPPTAYINHTVGGATGWFFNATKNTSATNYSAWASSQTFNLGDLLIFNSDSNQTVIQTYNLTTFKSCSIDDASDNDTTQYNGGASKFNEPSSIEVALTMVGSNYFFSDGEDGVQCQQGMAFQIQVSHGLGLPPSLNQPPPPPYATPPDSGSAQPPPLMPPHFNNHAGSRPILNVRQDFLIAVMPLLLLF